MAIIEMSTIIGAIVEIGIEGIWEKAKRREAVIGVLRKLGLKPDEPPPDFAGVYAYTLVEYGVGKPKPVLDFFRHEFIRDAFRRSFEGQDASILDREAESLVEWHEVGEDLRQMDVDPRREFACFIAVFNEIVDRTRTPAEVRRDYRLDDVHDDLHSRTAEIMEELEKLDALDEIRAELERLAQGHQSRQVVVTSVGDEFRRSTRSEVVELGKQDVTMERQRVLLDCLEKLTAAQFEKVILLTLSPNEQEGLTQQPPAKASFLNDMARWGFLDRVEAVLRQRWPSANWLLPYLEELDELSAVAQGGQTAPGLITDPNSGNQEHHLYFTNRQDELEELTRLSYPSAYHLVDAPAKYGKTRLLEKVGDAFEEKSWKCVYVSVEDYKNRNLLAIAQEFASQLKIPFDLKVAAQTDPRSMGYNFGESVKDHWVTGDGLVLLIDMQTLLLSMEQAIEDLLMGFIPGLAECLQGFHFPAGESVNSPFRVIVAGRYLRRIKKEILECLPWHVHHLTPFEPRWVRDATATFLGKDTDETSQVAAHLTYYTAGHPGCMASILYMYKDRGQSPDRFFTTFADEILRHIYREAGEVRANVPPELRKQFDSLSVFRCLNYDILEIWFGETQQEDQHQFADGIELGEALSKSGLMEWEEPDLLRDSVTRRLIAIRLMEEGGHRAFIESCQQAQRICQEYLQESSGRPYLWTIESLFQSLQQHSPYIQDTQKRGEIRERFLTTTVPDVLNRLIEGRDPRKIKKELNRALEADWEFEFTVNYFLRGGQYDGEPYKTLRKHINDFFAARISEQGDS